MTIKTDPKLLEQLKSVAGRPLSQDEIRDQRVSFIFSTMKDEPGVTRDKIYDLVDQHDGRPKR